MQGFESMTSKAGRYRLLLLALILSFAGQSAFALTPTPDCEGTRDTWLKDESLKGFMESVDCYCPSKNAVPVCTPRAGPSAGMTPPVGDHGGSEAFAVQMMGSLLGSFLQGILAPPRQDDSYKYKLWKQQAEKKKQEALNKQAMERWKKLREEERARTARLEAERRQRGRELLAKMQGIGVASLESFEWGTQGLDVQPIGGGVYDTSGYTSWQRMLCAAYFSSKALEAANSNDPDGAERARFMNRQADKVTAGEMTEVECRLPALDLLGDIQRRNLKENARLTEMVKLLPEVQERVKRLQEIEVKLNEAREGKEAAVKRLEEARVKVEEAEVMTVTARTPEEKSEADDLLRQALALQREAEAQVDEAEQAVEEFSRMREREQDEFRELKDRVAGVSKGPGDGSGR